MPSPPYPIVPGLGPVQVDARIAHEGSRPFPGAFSAEVDGDLVVAGAPDALVADRELRTALVLDDVLTTTAFRLRTGVLVVGPDGIVDASGASAVLDAAGAGVAAGTIRGSVAGVAGGVGVGAAGTAATNRTGGVGGGGGAGTAGAGGAGGTGTLATTTGNPASREVVENGYSSSATVGGVAFVAGGASGGAGAGDGAALLGGGSGAGGALLRASARALVNCGIFRCNGGAGGDTTADDAGGGAGSGAGDIGLMVGVFLNFGRLLVVGGGGGAAFGGTGLPGAAGADGRATVRLLGTGETVVTVPRLAQWDWGSPTKPDALSGYTRSGTWLLTSSPRQNQDVAYGPDVWGVDLDPNGEGFTWSTGGYTNLSPSPRDYGGPGWTVPDVVPTPGYAAGPDGVVDGARVQLTIPTVSVGPIYALASGGGYYHASAFVRGGPTPSTYQLSLAATGPIGVATAGNDGAAWQRVGVSVLTNPGFDPYYFVPAHSLNFSAIGGDAGPARDLAVTQMQLTQTETIRPFTDGTVGATVFPVPGHKLVSPEGWVDALVSPLVVANESAALIATDRYYVYIDANNHLRFRASDARFVLTLGGLVRCVSVPQLFAAGAVFPVRMWLTALGCGFCAGGETVLASYATPLATTPTTCYLLGNNGANVVEARAWRLGFAENTPTRSLCVEPGSSIQRGYPTVDLPSNGASPQNAPPSILNAFAAGLFDMVNRGVDSKTLGSSALSGTPDMLETMAADLAGYSSRRPLNLVVVGAPTNDFYFDAALEDVELYTVEYHQRARAMGFRTVAQKVIARGGGTFPLPPSFPAKVAAYNAWLDATWPQFADGLSDATLILNDFTDATYYQPDQTHLTVAGNRALALADLAGFAAAIA